MPLPLEANLSGHLESSLTSDLENLFSAMPIHTINTSCVQVSSLIHICPLTEEISRHAKYVLTDGQWTAYCLRRGFFDGGIKSDGLLHEGAGHLLANTLVNIVYCKEFACAKLIVNT